ncbi:hypothetical protein NADFUDRAFT_49212 [Nadsonia fulvescens var. elongata DSM 6958]|uniref:Uncharacterized protein n=1 Tax=Nadsonia fulvescens var. elongata DSM 6958 TaxID=857566 RepID=A0A1E3PTI3_9ASCO|nr:hypothetical protein NADFUDRAFT_49212 [Nadsonia fulvescens var. elongata DSM 6958]
MQIPSIGLDDLVCFHQNHIGVFDDTATQKLTELFHYEPEEIIEEYSEPEEEVIYYSDGVERTLTSEQIAFFRASELRQLHNIEKKAPSEHDPVDSERISSDSVQESRPHLAGLVGAQHVASVNQKFGEHSLKVSNKETDLDNIFKANCKKTGVRNYFPILPLRN